MNLPNKLTLGRIFLIPIIMIVYAIEPLRNVAVFNGLPHLSVCNFIILILTFIGAMTDLLDGKIARSRNLVTDLGKFLDPIADKLLVMTLLMIILDQGRYYGLKFRVKNGQELQSLIEWWMIVIIMAREFIVSGIRLVAANKKKVIAASWYGKVKTTVQFITILFLLCGCAITKTNDGLQYQAYSTGFVVIAKLLIYLTLISTILSGASYVTQNINLLVDKNEKKKSSK